MEPRGMQGTGKAVRGLERCTDVAGGRAAMGGGVGWGARCPWLVASPKRLRARCCPSQRCSHSVPTPAHNPALAPGPQMGVLTPMLHPKTELPMAQPANADGVEPLASR